jgi:outer membrane protein
MPDRQTFHRGLAVALFIAVAGIAVPSAAPAEQSKAPTVGIIDVQMVFRESSAMKGLGQKIEAQRAKYQEELRAEEQTLRAAEQELVKQRSILSADAFAKKRSEFEQKVASLRRGAQERKRTLEQFFNKGMSMVRGALNNIAKEIAEERGLDMILTKATVVVVKSDFDLTGEALKRLNKRLPEASVPGL